MTEHTTDIRGVGYGSDHFWKRGYTPQVGYASADKKYTVYKCKVCGETFEHYYDLDPDIFDGIKKAGVPESCSQSQAFVNKTYEKVCAKNIKLRK